MFDDGIGHDIKVGAEISFVSIVSVWLVKKIVPTLFLIFGLFVILDMFGCSGRSGFTVTPVGAVSNDRQGGNWGDGDVEAHQRAEATLRIKYTKSAYLKGFSILCQSDGGVGVNFKDYEGLVPGQEVVRRYHDNSVSSYITGLRDCEVSDTTEGKPGTYERASMADREDI